jgi:ABC-type Fe3+ transport system permease subunit
MPTVVTVYVTVLIGVMKLFDVVYVMTNGNFNTNVLATEFFNQLFTNFNNGYAAAIVVILMIAIIPVMIFQVRQFRSRRPTDDQHRPAGGNRRHRTPDQPGQPQGIRHGRGQAGALVRPARGRHHLLPLDRPLRSARS